MNTLQPIVDITAGLMYSIIIPPDYVPVRIDVFLASIFTRYSRSFFKNIIEDKIILRNGSIVMRESALVRPGDTISITFPLPRTRSEIAQEAMSKPDMYGALPIIFEHKDFLIINKPAGLIVHPPSSQSDVFTLSDWLVHTFADMQEVGYSDRPGIVHRLDKDTSGLMIIPRNQYAHTSISAMFKERRMRKHYKALVVGHPQKSGSITFPISRHPTDPKRMTHILPSGRDAFTEFCVIAYLKDAALIDVTLHTGRTHQIRVHMSALDHPVIGDAIYGTKSKDIARQALHASSISFVWENQEYFFEAPLPLDMQNLIRILCD